MPLIYRPCYSVLLAGLATALASVCANADQDVNITATVINNTCQVDVSDNGVVTLPTVRLDYFADNITAETDYPGGKAFTVQLVECPLDGQQISQITVNFSPQNGVLPADNRQVFSNDLENSRYGAGNVGLAIFSNAPDASRRNVLNSDGSTRAIYPVTADDHQHSRWPFYARMQQITDTDGISAGLLSAKVLVNITYQ